MMRERRRYLSGLGVLALMVLAACAAPEADQGHGGGRPAAEAGNESENQQELIAALGGPDQDLPQGMARALEPWIGDFDAMVERRLVRALVVPNNVAYFLDGPNQRGVTYELLKGFEDAINQRLQTGHLKVFVAIIPTTRDRLIPDLVAGRGDIAAANLTITPGREAEVDFSDPFLTGVDEIVVTVAGAPPLESIEDLAGKEVFVRETSSFHESLVELNERLRAAGKPEIDISPADELLETEDILEMVNAGLVPITVADTHLAEFWAQIHENIVLHPELTLRTGGQIAWAMRKDSPQLRQVVNSFVKDHKKGTLMGNMLLKRYLKSTKWVRNSLADEEMARFEEVVRFFQTYAREYDFDYLMVAAQGYQESRLDQSVRSSAGAIGVMQLLPSTAADPNVNIPQIEEIENNVHAGIKYMRFITNRYFDDPAVDDLNRTLLAFASYNAGPNRITRLRKKAAEAGLDPNVWFRNVEVIAAHDIGRETVQYVSNIYKYYLAYKMVLSREEARSELKKRG